MTVFPLFHNLSTLLPLASTGLCSASSHNSHLYFLSSTFFIYQNVCVCLRVCVRFLFIGAFHCSQVKHDERRALVLLMPVPQLPTFFFFNSLSSSRSLSSSYFFFKHSCSSCNTALAFGEVFSISECLLLEKPLAL